MDFVIVFLSRPDAGELSIARRDGDGRGSEETNPNSLQSLINVKQDVDQARGKNRPKD
jgi:hypothetical protein